MFTFLIGLCLGFLPSLIWLVFWLREDSHPESTKSLIKAFVGGMLAVPAAFIFQLIIIQLHGGNISTFDVTSLSPILFMFTMLVWATIEEIMKVLTISQSSLFSPEDDERVDPFIFLITSALGFAAVENTLFLLEPLMNGNYLMTFVAFDMRFIGATLLHVLASGVIGLAIGYSFYKPMKIKILMILSGFILASLLHAGFNLLIIGDVLSTMQTFGILWILVFIMLLRVEKLKNLNF